MTADHPQAKLDEAKIARAVTVARWREAEAKIYPLVLVDPALYEAAVVAVGALSRGALARCRTEGELFALDIEELVTDVRAVEPGAIDAAVSKGAPLTAMCEAALAHALLAVAAV
jgi:hypothetical protein